MKTPHVFGYRAKDPASHAVISMLVLFAIVMICFLLVNEASKSIVHRELWLTVGLIGFWRYSWKCIHAVRAAYYQYVRYPVLKRGCDTNIKPSELLVIVPSYRAEPRINYRVYKKLFDELCDYGVPSRVISCITDPNDVSVVEKALGNRTISVTFQPQSGKGKRDAMARALQLFADQGYQPDAQLVLMDGDSLLSDKLFHKSCRFLTKYNDLGAVTTDNQALVAGTSLLRQWYRQRMAQRHFYMNSLSLSHRLLVLTGRFSMFKAATLINPEFIHSLEHDEIHHWRYGRLKMLTGDDKSSWFHLLKYQWKMLYLPDVKIYCLEEAPSKGFALSSINLMKRWYGNMLRNNGRALKLGPKHCGAFLWLCLLDQRISIWTSLTGPVFVIMLSLTVSPLVLAAYFIWVTIGRGLNCLLVGLLTRTFHPYFIGLLWYEQVVGAAVKTYVLFRLDRQKWTRQSITAHKSAHSFALSTLLPRLMTIASITTLFLAIALYQGILILPG